jgi:hypothetical protein
MITDYQIIRVTVSQLEYLQVGTKRILSTHSRFLRYELFSVMHIAQIIAVMVSNSVGRIKLETKLDRDRYV